MGCFFFVKFLGGNSRRMEYGGISGAAITMRYKQIGQELHNNQRV